MKNYISLLDGNILKYNFKVQLKPDVIEFLEQGTLAIFDNKKFYIINNSVYIETDVKEEYEILNIKGISPEFDYMKMISEYLVINKELKELERLKKKYA